MIQGDGLSHQSLLVVPRVSLRWILTSIFVTWKTLYVFDMLILNCKTTPQHFDKKVWRQSLKTLGTCAIADVLLHVHILAKTWEIERDQKRKWQSYIFGTVMTLGLPVKKQFLTAANALGGNPDTLLVALPRDRASAPWAVIPKPVGETEHGKIRYCNECFVFFSGSFVGFLPPHQFISTHLSS